VKIAAFVLAAMGYALLWKAGWQTVFGVGLIMIAHEVKEHTA
jgi:hypothetical protein